MADRCAVTPAMDAEWHDWVESRPSRVRDVARRFFPWKLYRLASTGQRVFIVSISEPKNPKDPVTLTVAVTGQYNFVATERQVFGIKPTDLVECDLPGPREALGSANLSIEEVRRLMRMRVGRV